MNYYNEIKNELINSEVYKKIKNYSINNNELNSYYNVGKLLNEAGKCYGEGIIKEYSKKLTLDLGRKYTKSSLYNMLKFYNYAESKKFQTVSGKLTWSHYCELLSIDDINKINYYINVSINQNLSVRQLREKIKLQEYERLDESTKNKLINSLNLKIADSIKHPITIINKYDTSNISEKMLKGLIIDNIDRFLNELGEGFTYVSNEYKIRIGKNYNYIDILLYNIKFNCYVVIELKVTELKKEHIGQIQIYMNYIDENIKTIYQNKTIGIIIAKYNNEFVMRYCSDSRIYNTTYELV